LSLFITAVAAVNGKQPAKLPAGLGSIARLLLDRHAVCIVAGLGSIARLLLDRHAVSFPQG
jgi:hypothetical protein